MQLSKYKLKCYLDEYYCIPNVILKKVKILFILKKIPNLVRDDGFKFGVTVLSSDDILNVYDDS